MAALTWDKVSANNRSSLNAGMTIEIFNTGGDYGSERDRKQSNRERIRSAGPNSLCQSAIKAEWGPSRVGINKCEG